MTTTFTPTGAANAIITGLRAMCSDRDAKDEAERLAQLLLDMCFSIVMDGHHTKLQEKYADYLDGMAERLETWAHDTEQALLKDAYGPNNERFPQ